MTVVARINDDQRDAKEENGTSYIESLTSQTVEKWPQLREIG